MKVNLGGLKGFRIPLLASLFPMLEGEDLDELVKDIKQNGLRHPIITCEREVLDGRNRERACQLAGVEPRYEQWKPRYPGDTPLAFVISANLARRHLDASQRAMIAARLASLPKHKHKSDTSIDVSQPEAARQLKVGLASVQRASEVIKKAPELAKAVDGGRIKVSAASRAAKSPRSRSTWCC